MKKIKYILLFAAVTLGSTAKAQKSEADFIKISKEYILHADGSLEQHCAKQVKLNTHISFNSLYGETFIVYNPQYQKVIINHCYTIQHDGKKIEAPSNAFNEVLPSFAANAPAYNHLRELVVTHTGLEIGATIYLDYTIRTVAGYYDGVTANEVLQESSPVKEYVLSVEAPAGVNILYNQYNCTAPVKKENKMTWTMKNVPAAPREVLQTPDGRELPRVVFSTVDNQGMLAHLDRQITAPGIALKKKVAELTAGEQDAQKKASKIISLVINNINTVNVPMEYNAYKFRSVDEVYRTAYGTPLEKSVLLSAMLSEAGIKAVPAMAMPDYVEKGANNMALWMCSVNEFPVWMHVNKNSSFVSPIREGMYGWLDAGKICYALGKSQTQALQGISKSLVASYTYAINESKKENLTALALDVTKSGYYGTVLSTEKMDTLKKESSTQPLVVSKNNNYYMFTLPASNAGIDGWGIRTLSGEPRRTMLEIALPIDECDVYTCTIPANLRIASKNMEVSVKKEIGEVSLSYKIDAATNTLTVARSIRLSKKIITPAEYKSFKELLDCWNTAAYRTVLLSEK